MTESQPAHYSEWRRIANRRQGIVNMLHKKVSRLEAEIAALAVALTAANARNAMYDQREAA